MYQPFGIAPPPRLPRRLRMAIETTIERLIAICDADDGDLDVEWNGDELGDPSWPDRGVVVGGILWARVEEVAQSRRCTDHYFNFDMLEAVALASVRTGEDDEICPDACGEGDITGNGHLGTHPAYAVDQTILLCGGYSL